MFRQLALILLSAVWSAHACSIACVTPTTPLGNLLFHDVAVRVWVGNELPKPGFVIDPRMPWNEKHYYPGTIAKFFKGDYNEGRIIVRTNNNCGGSLQNQTSYLMFGSIKEEEVPGFIGKMPVLVMAGGCIPNQVFQDVSKESLHQLWSYKKYGPKCLNTDCPQNVAFAAALCPDRTTVSIPTQSCGYEKASNSCEWTVQPGEPCPSCQTDNDCLYLPNLFCEVDGLCAPRD